LYSSNNSSNQTNALIGFDGFIDKLFRIKKNENAYFEKAFEFGEYILQKKDNNFSLEIEEITTKIGGNAVNLSNALATLGVKNDLLASLGYPTIDPIFQEIHPNCNLISYASPGYAYAYEFANSKIMLAENGGLNTINWQELKAVIGIEKLANLFEINSLFCLVNWAEIVGMTSILEGILNEILPKLAKNYEKISFFDLSDCSNRNQEEIKKILSIITSFSGYTKVILSLNKNETETVYDALFSKEVEEFEEKGKRIFEYLKIEKLVLHQAEMSVCFCKNDGVSRVKTLINKKPLISTGAGDHFNAGFCVGILNNFPNKKALQFANATAGLYISSGKSPNLKEVLQLIDNQ
jgi:pfkB family carbohydrate kinase